MLVLSLEQGTQEWLDFRRTKLTATDFSSIIGVNPYKTAIKLWREKVLGESAGFSSYAADRGTAMEPLARAWAERQTGFSFTPLCVESSLDSRHMASLDGYDPCEDIILEIKCCGAKNHNAMCNGEIPPAYFAQIQWQLYVTGAKHALLCPFGGIDGVLIEIQPDLAYFAEHMPKVRAFEEAIDSLTEPAKPPRKKKASVS